MAIALKVTPVGRVTATGILQGEHVELPIFPWLFSPQQYAAPVFVSAQLCHCPTVSAVKVTPAGMVTATGMLLSVVVPLPSLPCILDPQQYTVPVVVRAQLCPAPAPIDAKVTPLGIVTATGALLLVVVPLPRLPY